MCSWRGQGTFEAPAGGRVPFFNMFVLSPTAPTPPRITGLFGFKARKRSALSGDIMEGLTLATG